MPASHHDRLQPSPAQAGRGNGRPTVLRRAPLPAARFTEIAAQVTAVLSGTCMAVQSRINGELGARTGDPAAAALVSFSVGLVIVAVLALVLPAGRRGTRRLVAGLRQRSLSAVFLASGVLGAFLVLVQTFTTPLVGVSVFILGVVLGQAVGGLGVDRIGFGPGGVKPLTSWRIAGTAVIVGAVVLAESPRFVHETGRAATAGVGVFVVMLAFQVLAGAGTAAQTAMNGRMAQQAQTPITSTLVNFAGGTVALAVTTVVFRSLADVPVWRLPGEWWLYLGGVAGLLFVAAGAVLVRIIGVLRTSLSLTAGMLTGALVLDLVVPTDGTVVAPLTVAGTALTFAGLVIVTLPWRWSTTTAG
ncbi:DMT family transporter [Kocuria coralli]|uniref:DMT family transporter n=1 Tax=Kocuria coralli TaxID=1461025 RepID=A0A5J5KW32_9MICC|nr:DMT family transporter [Kocuria coralli]KAA9393804.1 DMT family transporter [Kocuria coralli]